MIENLGGEGNEGFKGKILKVICNQA